MKLLIMKPGVWNGLTFDAKFCDELVANYDAEVFESPVVIGHRNGWNQDSDADELAHGWISSLWKEGNKVYAEVRKVSEELEELVEEEQLKYCSLEVPLTYSENSAPRPVPELRVVALLGRNAPAVEGAKITVENSTAAGTYALSITATGTGNYKGTRTATLTLIITKALDGLSLNYGKVDSATATTVSVLSSNIDDETYTASPQWSEAEVTASYVVKTGTTSFAQGAEGTTSATWAGATAG